MSQPPLSISSANLLVIPLLIGTKRVFISSLILFLTSLNKKFFIMGNFNILPSEIISEILSRLPTETVLDCKLVCKPWRDLVRLPSFSQIHLNHVDSGKLSYIFLERPESGEVYYVEYDDENCHEKPLYTKTRMELGLRNNYFVVGSCNGLVCIGASGLGAYYICNPVTGEYIKLLPKNPNNGDSRVRYWSSHWSGFGYSLTTNEYKVVRIAEFCSGRIIIGSSEANIVQVYTLGGGTGWRDAGKIEDINDMWSVGKGAGTFANGSLHWLMPGQGTIFTFHLADEKIGKLPLPASCLTRANDILFHSHLGVLGDFLSVTYTYYTSEYEMVTEYEIWLLKKNKDDNDFRWSKEFCFAESFRPLLELTTSDRRPGYIPFGYTKSGRLLGYWNKDGTILSYDPKDPSVNDDVSFGKYKSQPIPHKNTLVSLEVLGELGTKTMGYIERASSRETMKYVEGSSSSERVLGEKNAETMSYVEIESSSERVLGEENAETTKHVERPSSSEEVSGEENAETTKHVEGGASSSEIVMVQENAETMVERPSSSDETENSNKLKKKPQNKVRGLVVGFYALGVKKFIQKLLHLPKCC